MKIYYKPSCVTCKAALSELDKMRADIERRDFFKDRLSEAEIKKILKLSKMKARQILRTRDKTCKELGLENPDHTEAQLIRLMAKHPGLIRRPIIIAGDEVIVGKADPAKLRSIK